MSPAPILLAKQPTQPVSRAAMTSPSMLILTRTFRSISVTPRQQSGRDHDRDSGSRLAHGRGSKYCLKDSAVINTAIRDQGRST